MVWPAKVSEALPIKVVASQLHENAEIISDYKDVNKQQDFSARCEDVLTHGA